MKTKETRSAIVRRAAIASIVGVVGLGAGYALFRSATVAGVPVTAAAEKRYGDRLPAGTSVRYAIEWRGSQKARPLERDGRGTTLDVTAEVDMVGELSIVSYGTRDGLTWLGVRLGNLSRHSLVLLGKEAFADEARVREVFDGHEAIVKVEPNGHVRDVVVKREAPEAFGDVMRWVAAQLEMSLREGEDAWGADEPGPFGPSRTDYVRRGEGVERTRVRYERFEALPNADPGSLSVVSLDGRTSLSFAREGLLASIDTNESLRVVDRAGDERIVAELRFRMTLKDSARIEVRELEAAGYLSYGAPTSNGPTMREQMIAQRIDGLTRDQLVLDLTALGNAGTMPEHTRYMWRATALLAEDPEACDALLALVRSGKLSGKGQALVLDLLASAGSPAAQHALVEALKLPAVRRSKERALLVQRISTIETPTAETLAAAWETYREGERSGDRDVRFAGAFALGASAGNAAKSGRVDEARDYVRKLRHAADGAKDPNDKAAMLRALGNAGLPETGDYVRRSSADGDPRVREAAALALREGDDRANTDVLVGLVGDASRDVQAAALASLAARPLDAAHLEAIAALVLAGRLDPELFGLLLNVVGPHAGEAPAVASIARFLLEHEGTSTPLRARARAVLARSGGA